MAGRVQTPTLFFACFEISPTALASAGLIDPFLDVDVPLFIDPVLLEKSSNSQIRQTRVSAGERASAIVVIDAILTRCGPGLRFSHRRGDLMNCNSVPCVIVYALSAPSFFS